MLWLQPTVIKLVKSIALNPNYVLELSRVHSISPPHVMRILHELSSLEVLLLKKELNKKIYSVNDNSLLAREILRLSTLMMMQEEISLKKLEGIIPYGIYGSYAEGKFDGKSDLDLWVFGLSSKSHEVRSCINNLESSIGVQVNVLYIDKDKLEKLREQDSEFYLRLRYQSITYFLGVFHGKG